MNQRRPGRWQGDTEQDEAHLEDELPATRVSRAAEMGRIGFSLMSSIARAGAKALVQDPADRNRALNEAHKAGATVLFASLGKLRGTATKLGQFIAQRPGTLPDEYLQAMLDLTDQAPTMSSATVDMQIRNELEKSPRTLFRSFERTPLAAGSLGQVHEAVMHDGTHVVVKVQFPAVDEALESDLANLEMVLPAVERITKRTDLRGLVVELRQRLIEELDYRQEAENCREFAEYFAKEPIVIPKVHDALSTRRVLTLDFVEGDPIEAYLAKSPTLAERNRMTSLILRFHFASVLDHGVLHVDPNPGNYLFRADGSLGVLDFGCVKRFSPEFPDLLRTVYRAAADGRDQTIDDALIKCGMFRPDLPEQSRLPMRQLTRMWAKPCSVPNFDFGDRSYVDELMALQHRLAKEGAVTVPPEWLFYSRQVIGCAYLFYRLGGHHKSMFIESFEQLASGQPILETPAKKPRKKPANKRTAS